MRYISMLAFLTVGGTAVAADFGIDVPEGEARPLAAALGDAQDGATGAPKLYAGRVGKVCQKQGCWMTLIDGDTTARVMTGHRFFLPTDTAGEAVVYGTLQRRELDARTAEHFAKESLPPGDRQGATHERDAADASAKPGVEYRIDALAIRILERDGRAAP